MNKNKELGDGEAVLNIKQILIMRKMTVKQVININFGKIILMYMKIE